MVHIASLLPLNPISFLSVPLQVVTKLPGVDDDPDLVCYSKREQEELLRQVGWDCRHEIDLG